MCKAVEAASILLVKRGFKSLFTGAVEKNLHHRQQGEKVEKEKAVILVML
jgi:hypothetical protein